MIIASDDAPLITLSKLRSMTNCAIFDQSRSALANCNVKVEVRTRVRVRVRVSFIRIRVGVRFAQLAKCAARLVKRAH